jgi:hypothetical protein
MKATFLSVYGVIMMTDAQTEFKTAVMKWADWAKEYIKSVLESDLPLIEEGKNLRRYQNDIKRDCRKSGYVCK